MLTLQSAINNGENDQNSDDHDDEQIRDIHALTPPHPPALSRRRRRWDFDSRASSSSEIASSENFTTISREFNALVLAGSSIENNDSESIHTLNNHNQLTRIGEDHDLQQETNSLAIVPDNTYSDQGLDQQIRIGLGEPPHPAATAVGNSSGGGGSHGEVSVLRVKKEEVESKISAWQNAKIAKINNRFKREDAIINGWENEQVQKATSWMKKVERKLEEKRVKALEKMQNDVAKAHQKAEERRASAEAKRGTKIAKILEITNLMRTFGRPPAKKSFF